MTLIENYRKMLNIQRLSGIYKTRSYNLAEHSFGVATLFIHFAKKEELEYSKQDIENVLNHDIVETVTFDLPYHVKNHNQITKKLWATLEEEIVKHFPHLENFTDAHLEKSFSSVDLYRLFKACDILELYLFCKEEWTYGNMSPELQKVILKCESILYEDFYFNTISDFISELSNDID